MRHYEKTSKYRKTSEYRAWVNAKALCTNPKQPQYKDYGGRGIKMCEEWSKSFLSFIGYIGMKPEPSLTLDRIDNDKGYEPGNVQWATRKQQIYNRRYKTENLKLKKSRYMSLQTGITKHKSYYRAKVFHKGKYITIKTSKDKHIVEQALIEFAKSM